MERYDLVIIGGGAELDWPAVVAVNGSALRGNRIIGPEMAGQLDRLSRELREAPPARRTGT